jgi:hypothetical protein
MGKDKIEYVWEHLKKIASQYDMQLSHGVIWVKKKEEKENDSRN